MKATIALLALLAVATGCSSIPPGGDPAIRATDGRLLGNLAVAPVGTLALAPDEAAKGWQPTETAEVTPASVRASVVRGCEATRAFARVRASDGTDGWREGDDVLAHVTVENLRTHYDGRNAAWIPNMVVWFLWMIPSWWIATEEYSLTLDARVTLVAAETGRELARRTIPVRVAGTFDEFDRGWQFFGFVYSTLDAKEWRRIAEQLFPAARRVAAGEVALAIEEMLRGLDPAAAAEARRKTLALAIGVTRYEDATALPPLAFAADDARALAAVVAPRPEHAVVLVDSEATEPRVRAAVREHLSRARPGDSVVVYCAGYGTRRQDGRPELLLHDAQARGDRGRLALEELASLLREVAGTKLLVVDASFSGRGRSVAGGPPGDDLAALGAAPGLATLLACGPDEPALAPAHLGASLLAFHLARALRGEADEDRDGLLEADELHRFVRRWVVAESALLGQVQTPRAVGLSRGVVIR